MLGSLPPGFSTGGGISLNITTHVILIQYFLGFLPMFLYFVLFWPGSIPGFAQGTMLYLGSTSLPQAECAFSLLNYFSSIYTHLENSAVFPGRHEQTSLSLFCDLNKESGSKLLFWSFFLLFLFSGHPM